MRKLPALIVAAALVASLAACSSQGSAANCSPEVNAGDASSLVTAKGTFGAKPKVEFPTPIVDKSTQVSTLKVGKGETLVKGDYADMQVSIWNAKNGDYVTGTTFKASSPTRSVVGGKTGFGPALQCVTVGSRIAAVATLKQFLGNVDGSSVGLTSTSPVIAVIDVQNGMIGKANGSHQIPQSGFPSVVTAPDGTPGVTIPNVSAPTKLESVVLKRGNGETVKKGDTIVMQFEGLVWGSPGSVFKSTWTDPVPASFLAAPYNVADGTGLMPGTDSAIIGEKVGSQILVVVPPSKSYPASATAPDGVAKGSTRIYVFDILDIQK